ncbi:MAG: MarR family transcriptional regulator [Caulobacteraceae bacterium]|nr:MarR family transcriptional regulator [Caulobacteraceae bacterium]
MPKSSALLITKSANDGPLDQSGLDRLIGFHLRMAQVAVWREFCVTLEPLDLTQKQLAVLTLVRDNPGASQIDMAQVIATDRATMMALIDRLQERGLVERRPSSQDRRRQEIHLTQTGVEMTHRAEKLIDAHEHKVLSKFTAGEQALLLEMLSRFYKD